MIKVVEFANDSGDEITDAIANALNKKQKENQNDHTKSNNADYQ